MSKLSIETEALIQKYQNWHEYSKEKEINTIHVDEIASRVASFYEKIRGIIDWKEEHLLKRAAAERALKRRIYPQINPVNGSLENFSIESETLVLELIRGGHFPNDKIPYIKIKEVEKALEKYVFILNNIPSKTKKSKIQIYNWLSCLAACEIEQILTPSLKQKGLIDYMFSIMKKRVVLQEGIVKIKPIKEEEKNIQIYIAIQRALFKLDDPIIGYHLFKYKYGNWDKENLAKNIYSIEEEIEKTLNHKLKDSFYQICQKYNTPFLLISDILDENPEKIKEIFFNSEILEINLKKHYDKRLKTLRKRTSRAAFYATVSIFLSNVIALIAIEQPVTRLMKINFPLIAIIIDILVPTFLMAFLVITIKSPPKGNLEKVIMESMKIINDSKNIPVYEIKTNIKRGLVLNIIINFLYTLFFSAFLGLIIFGLYIIKFPPLSYIIFIIFLSLIAFAGMKIRKNSQELHMIEEKDNALFLLIDPFAVPIIQLGKWLTNRWKKYNIISIVFSALIDMPFLSFVRFLEQWRYFLKEKKDKIY
ncbi:MAG: hypothetical protein PHN37_02630 [Candidatus Pacebacteria bacterium]|nr:hypothetical protein [Candidatus Paceibacterota bacterium]